MRLSFKKIKQASVETVSGVKLGHVSDIIFEIDGQLIVQYIVKHSMLISKEYTISRDQIVRFEDKKIIVDDNVEKAKQKSRNMIQTSDFTSGKNTPINPEPISMSKNV